MWGFPPETVDRTRYSRELVFKERKGETWPTMDRDPRIYEQAKKSLPLAARAVGSLPYFASSVFEPQSRASRTPTLKELHTVRREPRAGP